MEFKLILVFVDEDHSDQVLDAAREAGATGATIINNAQGQGLKKRFGLFGLEVLDPRTVLLILVESRRAEDVLSAIGKAGELDESINTGVALEIDVSRTIGLTEHIKALSERLPLDR